MVYLDKFKKKILKVLKLHLFILYIWVNKGKECQDEKGYTGKENTWVAGVTLIARARQIGWYNKKRT